MKITENKTTGLKKDYNIVIPADEVSQKCDTKLKTVSKDIKMDGFRRGKVPLHLLKKQYGASIFGDAVDELVKESVSSLYKEKNIRPALQPKLDFVSCEEGKDLEFNFALEILPEIPEVDFSGIQIEKVFTEVDEEEVNKNVSELAKQHKTTVKIEEERESKKGDVLLIDFTGSVDGVEFKGGKGTDYKLELGSNSFIPGFEDQLIGRKAGTDVLVKVTFPTIYHAKDLAGKEADFLVKIKEIHEYTETKIDDELAKSFGAKNLDDLKELIKKELSFEYENVTNSHLKRALLDALAKAYSFDIPEGMFDLEYASIIKQVEEEEKAKGNDTLDDKTKDEYKDIATRRVRLGLVVSEIGQKNNIQPTSADINRVLLGEARRYPGQEKMFIDLYSKNANLRDSINAQVFEDKVISFLLEKVKIEPRKVSAKELYSWYDKEEAKAEEPKAEPKKEKKATSKKGSE